MKITTFIRSNAELYTVLKSKYEEIPITEGEVSIIYHLHKQHQFNFCVLNNKLYTVRFGVTSVTPKTHHQSIITLLQRTLDWLNKDIADLINKESLAQEVSEYASLHKELEINNRRKEILNSIFKIVRSRLDKKVSNIYDVSYILDDYTDNSFVYVELPSRANGLQEGKIYEIKCIDDEVYIDVISDFDMGYIMSENNRYFRLSKYLPTLPTEKLNTINNEYEEVTYKAMSIFSHFPVLKSEIKYMDYFDGIVYALEHGMSFAFCTEYKAHVLCKSI